MKYGTTFMLCWLMEFSSLMTAQTIPVAIAEANKSLGRSVSIELAPAPSVEAVLSQTDLIVTGTLGQPRSYLSEDQNNVLTDFPILQPVYLFPLSVGAKAKPIAVTQTGGTIAVLGHTFTEENKRLPRLSPGVRYLFLLTRDGQRYRIAAMLYGVFRIDTDLFTPLAADQNFASDFRQLRPDEAISRLLSRAAATH